MLYSEISVLSCEPKKEAEVLSPDPGVIDCLPVTWIPSRNCMDSNSRWVPPSETFGIPNYFKAATQQCKVAKMSSGVSPLVDGTTAVMLEVLLMCIEKTQVS